MKYTHRITYENSTQVRQRIVVEPWADTYTIEPGQDIDIVVTSDTLEGALHIEQGTQGLLLWANAGDTDIVLMSNGQELEPGPEF
jgi:hypothetical protein